VIQKKSFKIYFESLLARHMLYRRQITRKPPENNKEDIMRTETKTNTKTKAEQEVNVGYEASRFALYTGMGMAALIGLRGRACLIGGLATNGIGPTLKGFWTAATGM
jgi:endo-1,4-beta-D-glucanase Y